MAERALVQIDTEIADLAYSVRTLKDKLNGELPDEDRAYYREKHDKLVELLGEKQALYNQIEDQMLS
jgi:hypothetical protein